MADMAEIIGSDTAHIHAYFAFYLGLEHLLLPTHCIVQPQFRRGTLMSNAADFFVVLRTDRGLR